MWNFRTTRAYHWTIKDGTSSVYEPCIWSEKRLGNPVPCTLEPDRFYHFTVVGNADGFDCYLDGQLIHKARQARIPLIDSVTTVDRDTVYLKILNLSDRAESISIHLDTPVEDKYEMDVVSAASPEAVNTFECPDAVIPERRQCHGAKQTFQIRLQAFSLSVLRLKMQNIETEDHTTCS